MTVSYPIKPEVLKSVLDAIDEHRMPDHFYEDGDCYVVVLEDAMVIVSMEDGRLKIDVVMDEPVYLDMKLEDY